MENGKKTFRNICLLLTFYFFPMKQPIPDPPPLAHRLQIQTGRPFLFWQVPVPQFCEQQAPIHSFAATSLKPHISMRAQTEKISLSRLARSSELALTASKQIKNMIRYFITILNFNR